MIPPTEHVPRLEAWDSDEYAKGWAVDVQDLHDWLILVLRESDAEMRKSAEALLEHLK